MKTLKQTRLQLGLTQEKMAGLLGISPTLLSKVEAGSRQLPDKAFLKFSELAAVTPVNNLPRRWPLRGLKIPDRPQEWLDTCTSNLSWRGRRMLALADHMERQLIQARQSVAVLPTKKAANQTRESTVIALHQLEAKSTLKKFDQKTIDGIRRLGKILLTLEHLDDTVIENDANIAPIK